MGSPRYLIDCGITAYALKSARSTWMSLVLIPLEYMDKTKFRNRTAPAEHCRNCKPWRWSGRSEPQRPSAQAAIGFWPRMLAIKSASSFQKVPVWSRWGRIKDGNGYGSGSNLTDGRLFFDWCGTDAWPVRKAGTKKKWERETILRQETHDKWEWAQPKDDDLSILPRWNFYTDHLFYI